MTQETKQEVFEETVNELEDVLPETALFGKKYIDDLVGELRSRYAAASPCKLPTVPPYIDKYIRRTQAARINLVNVMAATYQADRFVEDPDPELVWINRHPDTFALAWLLKDWDVEEEKQNG